MAVSGRRVRCCPARGASPWIVSDDLWERIEPLLPKRERRLSWRHEVMLDTGVTPRPGLAEAVTRLQAAGTAQVYMATVTASQRRFILVLSEDLTQCVACW